MNNSGGPSPPSERLGLILALVMAAAAVFTAWAGFQSTKWSGVQADSYAEASADRTEATRAGDRAGQQLLIDVTSFTQWLTALDEEIVADQSARPGAAYKPPAGSISGFIFNRFRPEFQPAVEAWLRTQPFVNEDAPPTPFVMPEYRLAEAAESDRLEKRADELARQARDANQRADNYVLTAVLFALVLFFAGVADRAMSRRAQKLLSVLAAVGLVGALVVLLTLPIEL